jgi:hypothetical protein
MNELDPTLELDVEVAAYSEIVEQLLLEVDGVSVATTAYVERPPAAETHRTPERTAHIDAAPPTPSASQISLLDYDLTRSLDQVADVHASLDVPVEPVPVAPLATAGEAGLGSTAGLAHEYELAA